MDAEIHNEVDEDVQRVVDSSSETLVGSPDSLHPLVNLSMEALVGSPDEVSSLSLQRVVDVEGAAADDPMSTALMSPSQVEALDEAVDQMRHWAEDLGRGEARGRGGGETRGEMRGVEEGGASGGGGGEAGGELGEEAIEEAARDATQQLEETLITFVEGGK